MPDTRPGPLASVRVIDLTDDRAIYAGKLLADLGAQVTRVEPSGGDPLRQRAPFHQNGASLWHAFFASSRQFLKGDADTIAELAESADIILDCERLPDPDALLEANPSLVIIDVTSFGRSGPWQDYRAPGLVAEALGGIAATSGDVDTPPLKLYGDQYAFIGGVYAAIGALAALNHARETGEGQLVRLSTHEAFGTILEHVLMWAWYHEMLPFGDGPVLRRQGSLHWSNAYVVMQAIGGSIMITPTPDFSRQAAWLVEEGRGFELLDERFSDPANVAEMIDLTMSTLREWVSTKEVESFFHEAQARHHPYGWVMTTPEVAGNPQLEARDWWTEYPVGDTTVIGPGAPYHFSDTPWRIALVDPTSPSPYTGAAIDARLRPDFTLAEAHRTYQRLLYPATTAGLADRVFGSLLAKAEELEPDDDRRNARYLRDGTSRHRDWLAADEERAHYRERWRDFFGDCDILLSPTVPTTAIRHDHSNINRRTITVDGETRDYWDQIIWPGMASMAGLPATVAPVGLASDGLPVGIQIMGPYLEDASTIDFARRLGEVVGGYEPPPAFR